MILSKASYISFLLVLQIIMTRVSSSFVSSCISQFTSEYAADNFISQQDLSTFLHSYSTDTSANLPSFDSLDPFVQIAFARFVCGGNEQCRLDIMAGDELGYTILPDDEKLNQKVQDLCMALYLHGHEFHGEVLQTFHVDLYFLLGFEQEIKGDFMVDYSDALNSVSTVLYNVMHWKTFIVRSLGTSDGRLLQAIPPTLQEVVQYTDHQTTSCPDEFKMSLGCVLLSSTMHMYADPSRFTLEDVTEQVHSIIKESINQGNFLQQLNDFELDTGVENDIKEILYVDSNAVSPTFMPSSIPSFSPSISESLMPSAAPSFEMSFVPTNVASSAPSSKSTTTNTTANISTNTTTTSTTDVDDGSRGSPDQGLDPSLPDNKIDPDSIVVIATLGIMLITLLILFTVKKYQLKKRERWSHFEEEEAQEEDVVEADEEMVQGSVGGEQSESVSSLEVE